MHGSNQRKFFKKIYTRISRIGLGFIYVYLKVSCNFGRRKPFNKKKNFGLRPKDSSVCGFQYVWKYKEEMEKNTRKRERAHVLKSIFHRLLII